MTLKGIEREVEEAAEEGGWGEKTAPKAGQHRFGPGSPSDDPLRRGSRRSDETFSSGRRHGNDNRFWRLAQAFSALYPAKSDEKRWVDGVLARKKGLGF